MKKKIMDTADHPSGWCGQLCAAAVPETTAAETTAALKSITIDDTNYERFLK